MPDNEFSKCAALLVIGLQRRRGACGARQGAHQRHRISIQAELTEGRDTPRERLRVVAPHAQGQDLLMKPLADYLCRYPEVSVK